MLPHRTRDSVRSAFFIQFPLPLLHRLGRGGGVIALGLSAITAYEAVWLWRAIGPDNGADGWSPMGVGVAGVFAAASLSIAVQALWLLLRGKPPSPRLEDAELLRRLVSAERPLAVCFECRTLSAVPTCEHCHQSSSCLDIFTRVDVRNAISLLGLVAPSRIAAPPDIAPALQASLRMAIADAKRMQHEFVTIEHLLAGLLRDPRCVELLEGCGAEVERLKQRLNTFLVAEDRPRREDGSTEPRPSPEIERVLEAAAVRALSGDNDVMDASDVLIAICAEDSSQAFQCLQHEGVTPVQLGKLATETPPARLGS